MTTGVMDRVKRFTLGRFASWWWHGPDEGRPVRVEIELRVPTHRTDKEVLDLFSGFGEEIGGGYPGKTLVSRLAE